MLRNPADKLLDRAAALERFGRPRTETVVFTNGCFDVLHRGHVEYLDRARRLGDRLVVGVNTDASVRRLKGPERPLVGQADRARILAALECVDAVVLFGEETPRELIAALLPDVLTKGGDYGPEGIVGREEVVAAGGRIEVIPFVEGYSTTELVERIRTRDTGEAGAAGRSGVFYGHGGGMSEREDRWSPDHLRTTRFEPGWSPYAEGSCLVSNGRTRVLCNASILEEVPVWREASGKGWVTAEYAMLPRATHTRRSRERGRVGGRTEEIQRLIGRSLRAVTDLGNLGPRTIVVDCDVLQADGGTRTASVTGGCVALYLACESLVEAEILSSNPVVQMVAAVSVGLVDDALVLDLDYEADRNAQVDMNVVATASGELVEVQGTAEGRAFTRREHEELLKRALGGIAELVRKQEELLSSDFDE